MDIVQVQHYASMIALGLGVPDSFLWSQLVEAADGRIDQSFTPVAYWRYERQLWTVDLYVADAKGMTIGLHVTPTELQIETAGGETPDHLIFRKFIAQGGVPASQAKIVLLVDRPYDAAQRYFQLAVLLEQYPDFTPDIAVSSDRNSFSYRDILSRVGSVSMTSYSELVFDAPDPTVSMVQCIRFDNKKDFLWRKKFRQALTEWKSQGSERSILHDENIIRIFISFDLEKRKFTNQVVYFRNVIKIALDMASSAELYINGMTGWVDKDGNHNPKSRAFFSEFDAVEDKLLQEITKGFPLRKIVRLQGLDIMQKARAISPIDFFVAPLGSAAMIPMQTGIPGVTYCSPKFRKSYGWMLEGKAVIVPENSVVAADGDPINQPQWARHDATGESYDIDMDTIVTLTRNTLDHLFTSS